MLYPKIIAGVAAAGLLLSQEIPDVSTWAKTPVEVLCACALAWVSIRTIPGMVDKFLADIETQRKTYKEQLEQVLTASNLNHAQMSLMMGEKLQQQTEILSRVILESNLKQS